MKKGSIYQAYTSINIHLPKSTVSKYMKHTQTKDRVEGRNMQSTIILGNFNTQLSIIDITSRQNIRKEIDD